MALESPFGLHNVSSRRLMLLRRKNRGCDYNLNCRIVFVLNRPRGPLNLFTNVVLPVWYARSKGKTIYDRSDFDPGLKSIFGCHLLQRCPPTLFIGLYMDRNPYRGIRPRRRVNPKLSSRPQLSTITSSTLLVLCGRS